MVILLTIYKKCIRILTDYFIVVLLFKLKKMPYDTENLKSQVECNLNLWNYFCHYIHTNGCNYEWVCTSCSQIKNKPV